VALRAKWVYCISRAHERRYVGGLAYVVEELKLQLSWLTLSTDPRQPSRLSVKMPRPVFAMVSGHVRDPTQSNAAFQLIDGGGLMDVGVTKIASSTR
jgi:hypothetical protein